MPFPVYYNGQILFRNGLPAMSLNCCCDGRPPIETPCCGDTIEIEYEIYDETSTTVLFSGFVTFVLDESWVNAPGTGDLRESSDPFALESGEYRVALAGKPYVTCQIIPGQADAQMTVNAIISVFKNDVAYDTQNINVIFSCPLDGVWTDWVGSPPARYKVRYT
jgi:hypothetical protein